MTATAVCRHCHQLVKDIDHGRGAWATEPGWEPGPETSRSLYCRARAEANAIPGEPPDPDSGYTWLCTGDGPVGPVLHVPTVLTRHEP